jgi:hypothetical protein
MVIESNQHTPASEKNFLDEKQLLKRPSKLKRPRASKKSGGLRQRLLIASGILTIGFKFIKLIEELQNIFKP